ncbi:MAG TPA: ornithine carbamoyltransferase, partial [Bacillota bacterium]
MTASLHRSDRPGQLPAETRIKDVLTGAEFGGEALLGLLEESLRLKSERPGHGAPLAGKTLALIFAKPSTRTRVSFEVGIKELGGDTIVLHSRDMQLGRGESIEDTGAVLSRYVAGLAVRTHAHAEVEALAAASSVPVINMLTDLFHPCQALADLLTLLEQFGRLDGLRVAYVGDGNNVLHSLLLTGAAVGVRFRVATPPGFEPAAEVVDAARCVGGPDAVVLTHVAEEAAAGAHAVYTDVWTSMGREDERETRLAA